MPPKRNTARKADAKKRPARKGQKEPATFRVQFSNIPMNGRVGTGEVIVTALDGKVIHTDRINPADAADRRRLARAIAAKTGCAPDVVLAKIDEAWNQQYGDHLRATTDAAAQQQTGQAAAVQSDAAGYSIENGCLCRQRATPEGYSVPVALCNFAAQITEVVTHDDGAQQTAFFTLTGTLASGQTLPPISVRAAAFAGMEWVTRDWQGEAILYAGQGVRDHARTAIEVLSPKRTRRAVYAHTGWRRVGEQWCYLHGGGAIGPVWTVGTVQKIEVALPGSLGGYVFPDLPEGEALTAAVRCSLALLDGLGPDRIMLPLLGGVYRAALGEAPGPIDMSLWLHGPHGVFKSQLAALAAQHYGAGMDSLHLPGSWSSTANSLELLAFGAKDAVLVVDDYAPRGSIADRQRQERDADRLLRAQGNGSARQRMAADGSLRPARPPRGLILSTGEDVPPGHSLGGRMLLLEVCPGDVDRGGLSRHQRAAKDGHFARSMAGFLRWLAPQYEELSGRLPAERDHLREKALAGAASARTPAIVADLCLGLRYFFAFAVSVGAITEDERAALTRRAWTALQEDAKSQAEHLRSAEPAELFVRLLAGTVGTTAHVAGLKGKAPLLLPESWGWEEKTFGGGDHQHTDWYPRQGTKRIGWTDGENLFLEPEESYAVANDLARRKGECLPVSMRSLHKRLKEKGLLATWDQRRERLTIRRTVEGAQREVLHLRADSILPSSLPSKPSKLSSEEEEELTTAQVSSSYGRPPLNEYWDGPE
jgi:hypothetical protein